MDVFPELGAIKNKASLFFEKTITSIEFDRAEQVA